MDEAHNREYGIRKFILGIVLIAILPVGIILIIFYKIETYQKTYTKEDIKGEIQCEFNLEITSSQTKILGDEFSKKTDFDIEINGGKVKLFETYKAELHPV